MAYLDSYMSIPAPYSNWVGIQLPTTPNEIASDPIWSHRSNYKQLEIRHPRSNYITNIWTSK